jgi:hypothetical protein
MPRRKQSTPTTVWNAGTAVNVFAIPIVTFVFLAGGFYFVDKYKFEVYDLAAADVTAIKIHNATADQQVKDMGVLLEKISTQIDDLRRSAPISGPGSGGGAAVGGGLTTRH